MDGTLTISWRSASSRNVLRAIAFRQLLRMHSFRRRALVRPAKQYRRSGRLRAMTISNDKLHCYSSTQDPVAAQSPMVLRQVPGQVIIVNLIQFALDTKDGLVVVLPRSLRPSTRRGRHHGPKRGELAEIWGNRLGSEWLRIGVGASTRRSDVLARRAVVG